MPSLVIYSNRLYNSNSILISDINQAPKEEKKTSEALEEQETIETIYDGFIAKIQACGVKGSMIFTNVPENVKGNLFESAEALIEQFYLGCLSNEMLTFLWTGHLDTTRHKERLLNFYKFFNHDPSSTACSMYFTIFPQLLEAENYLLEDEKHEDVEENFSSKGIYVKITQISYQQNNRMDMDFINAKNSKLIENKDVSMVDVEHFFAMKKMQIFFTKFIGEKIIRHLSQSLNIKQFRKGTSAHLSKQAEQAIANSPTKIIEQFPFPQHDSQSKPNNPIKKQSKKKMVPDVKPSIELQIVVSIDIPQINIQNELKKSQAIITTGERIYILVYNTYVQDRDEKYWIQKAAWTFIPSLGAYIAPTNLYKEEKTMWLNPQEEKEGNGKRNLMEIIMVAKNNEVLVNVMNPEFYDLVRPMMSLDVKVFKE